MEDEKLDFVAHIGSCKSFPPKPVTTSWGMNDRRSPPPPRKASYWFALDEAKENGLTVARTKTLEDAYKCMERLLNDGLRTVIRPVEITEESLQNDSRENKKLRQLGII